MLRGVETYSVSKTIAFHEKLYFVPSNRCYETNFQISGRQISRHCQNHKLLPYVYTAQQLNKGTIILVFNAELTLAFRIKRLKKIKNWLTGGEMGLCQQYKQED